MKGTIIERPKGSRNFCIRYSAGFDATTGKYRQVWESGFNSITEARARLTELEHQKNTGMLPTRGKLTVGDYLEKWLRDYAKPNLSPKGFERYDGIARVHLVPALGKIRLSELRPEHLQQLYAQKLSTGLAPRTVKYHHTILHVALETAVKWGIIPRNVADAVSPPKAQRTDMQTWDESEISRFLEEAKSTQYHALFFTDLFTGMRRSELLALRWQDVDLPLAQVNVSRGLHQLKDRSFVFTQPKSAKSVRSIALSPSAVLTLQNYRTARALEAKMLSKELKDSDLVFSHLDGSPLRPNSVSRAWENTAKRAGVKVIRMHDGRHSHASIMLKQGIHPKIVSERLGHSSIQITLDTYSHVTPGLQEAAAARFDEVLNPKYNVTVN